MDTRSNNNYHLFYYTYNFQLRFFLRIKFPWKKAKSKLSRITWMLLKQTWIIRRSRTILPSGGEIMVAGVTTTTHRTAEKILNLNI